VNESDRGGTFPFGPDSDLRTRLSGYETADIGDRAEAGPGTGLVSLSFLFAALGRSKRLWCTLAVVGLLLGVAYIKAVPPGYTGTTSVLLADNPSMTPANEVPVDAAVAASIPVAAGVVRQLGLSESPSSFAATYQVTTVTYQVLRISVSGQNADDAMRKASAIATQFLKFRAQYQQSQERETDVQLDQQLAQARQQLDSITTQVNQVSAQPSSPAQQTQLAGLKKKADAASTNFGGVQTYVIQAKANIQTVTNTMVTGSQVLNPAMLAKRSPLKSLVTYGVGGLIGGLVLGMVIAIVAAVTSDRLRRRDDIAHVLGAPVRLTVGSLRASRLIPALPKRAAIRRRDLKRVVDHLNSAVPGSPKGPAGLAVAAVDDPTTAARAVVGLAAARAKQNARVVVADLSAGVQAARLLGVKGPGVHRIDWEGSRLVVVVPDPADVAPSGPLESATPLVMSAPPDEALVAACRDADLVLSLIDLDPALGADNLPTWATEAVAVITAGRSTAVRVHAAGEMIRLSGTRLGSVVVVGVDKYDESLGLTSVSL
jgi:capsular polysaccharide biosynthesis protein